MNFKKILPIVLTVFALAACGKSKDPDVPGNTEYPENNKTYKLGFENENLGDIFYFTGEMSTYYGATTTDFNSAIDVKTVKSGSGWKLTFEQNGIQNIGVAISGTHTNFVFGTDVSTIWTYDADYNTFLTTISGTQYWIGSLGSKSYETIGAYYVDEGFDSDFHCHLYTADGVTNVPNDDPQGPGTSNPDDDFPTNGKAYKLGFENENLGSTFYFTGEMEGYYGATTTDFYSGVDVITEKSGDGWKLSFNNGSKQYIGVTISGSHTNFTYGNSINCVWTYDADYDTLLTTISGTQYWIGSLGSKNYETISAYRVDDNFSTDFHCHLYESDGSTGGNGGSTGGESGNELEEVVATYAEALDTEYYYDDYYGDYYFEVVYEPTVSFLDAVTDVLDARPSGFTILDEPFEDYWDEEQTDPGAFAYIGTPYTSVIIELGAYYYADEDIVIVQGVSFYEE